MIEIGKSYRFTYPDYGTPDCHPDHTAHSGQTVKVLCISCVDDELNTMFVIQAADDWLGYAWSDELETVASV